MHKYISYFLVFFISKEILSQNTSNLRLSNIDFELYGDFFINGTLSNTPSHKISDYLYSYNRTNEFGINLVYLKSKYNDSNFRMNLALMSGTYGQDNYANESDLFKNLFEANVGFKLSKTRNEWLDVGVFPSHIGAESAVSYDCWNLSRSLLAENSPYYETGLKYTKVSQNEKFTHSFLLLNGWQRIAMIPGYSIPALGMQFVWKPNEKTMLNYSNFLGSSQPDSTWALRVYNNFYLNYKFSENLSGMINFDIGRDEVKPSISSYWYGLFGAVKYQIDSMNTVSLRGEFLEDNDNVLYPSIGQDWFTYSSSINYDRKLNKYSILRFEVKYMNSSAPIFLPNYKDHLGAFLALQVKI